MGSPVTSSIAVGALVDARERGLQLGELGLELLEDRRGPSRARRSRWRCRRGAGRSRRARRCRRSPTSELRRGSPSIRPSTRPAPPRAVRGRRSRWHLSASTEVRLLSHRRGASRAPRPSSVEQRLEPLEPLAGVVELEQALRVERADGRPRRSLERGAHGSSSSGAASTGAARVAELGAHRQHPTEQALRRRRDAAGVGGHPLGFADHVDRRRAGTGRRRATASRGSARCRRWRAGSGRRACARPRRCARRCRRRTAGRRRPPRSRARSARRRTGRRRAGRSPPARGSGPRRGAAAAPRAGTGRCRAGTSASSSAITPTLATGRGSVGARTQARGGLRRLLATFAREELGEHVELAWPPPRTDRGDRGARPGRRVGSA